MKNNNIQFWAIVVIVALVAGVLGALVAGGITGNAISGTYSVSANSCDADDTCEVAKTISTKTGSTSALVLTSDAKRVAIEGDLYASSLSGSANAYACLDSTGKLYRSVTACKVDTPSTQCTDTDGGIDYFTPGIVNGISVIETNQEGKELKILSKDRISWTKIGNLGVFKEYNLGDEVPSFPWTRAKLTKINFISLKNPKNSAEITYISVSDYCSSDGKYVIEQSCNSQGTFGDSYACPKGCKDGACIK